MLFSILLKVAVGPRDWDIDFAWNIADLIWSSDQTSIDSRSRLTVQLRQDILSQVTHLYYERKRLKVELSLSPPENKEERFYKELELQEITANLDGLTNGYFSRFIHSRPQNRAIYGADGAWPLSIPPKEPLASARVGSI